MNRRAVFSFALISILYFLSSCSKDEETPKGDLSISSMSPHTGNVGTLVTITGTGFNVIPDENIVTFNNVAAEVEMSSATHIMVTVPSQATTGRVNVKVGEAVFTGPTFTVLDAQTKAYFIKFKADGVLKVFETGNPGFQSCGDCACSYLPPASQNSHAFIDICNDDNVWVTSSHIQAMDGKTFQINVKDVFPIAEFGFKENGKTYLTDNVDDQSGSEVKITSVVSDGEFLGGKGYKVSGTFKCKVANSDDSDAVEITEGEFTVRYTEDF